MQVHDELVLEVPEKELDEVKEKVRELMQNVAKLDVALVTDAGERQRGGFCITPGGAIVTISFPVAEMPGPRLSRKRGI